MSQGTFWSIRFSTGGVGNKYATRAEAEQYADAVNRYNEQTRNERIVRAVLQYKHWELVKELPV